VLIRLLLAWVANTASLLVAVALLNGVSTSNLGAIVVAGAVFGLLNTFLKPLLKILGLPLHIITLGLSLFLVNMLIVWLTAVTVSGLHIHGFGAIAATTVIVWAANTTINTLPPFRDRR
jgi:putative membrane protein